MPDSDWLSPEPSGTKRAVRIWSFKLRAGASATVEARFEDDGAHWIVIMKDRGPGIDVTLGMQDRHT